MDPARLDDLLDAYLDRRLGEDDKAALDAELRSNADSRRRFWEHAQQHALLAELLAEDRGVRMAEEECAAARALAPAEAAPSGRRLTTWVAALAASLLLAVLAGWLLRRPDAPAPMARLGEVRGQVSVVVDKDPAPARKGQVIRSGDEIRTGADGFAVVTYQDDSRLELTSDTAVRLHDEAGPGRSVYLVRGVVSADVAKRPMRLSTQEADVMATGSRLSAAGLLGETRIEVEQGNARLSRKGDDNVVEMSAGTYAVSAPDQEMYRSGPMVPASGAPEATLREPSGPVLTMAALDSGRGLAVGCWDGTVRLYDVRTHQPRATLDAGRFRVWGMAPSRDGRWLAVGYEAKNKKDSAATVWDLHEQTLRLQLPCPHKVGHVAFAPDGRSLALVGGDRTMKGAMVWDLPDLARPGGQAEPRERLLLGQDRPECLAVSPDGRLVAVGYRDGVIRLWDTLTGRLDRVLEGHKREVQSLAFSPSGDVLASGGRDGSVRLWSPADGGESRELRGSFNEVRCMTFSPDGRALATGHAGVAVLWDAKTGEKRSTLKAHKFALTALAYLDGGRVLATAGWDRTVKLWKLEPLPEG